MVCVCDVCVVYLWCVCVCVMFVYDVYVCDIVCVCAVICGVVCVVLETPREHFMQRWAQ